MAALIGRLTILTMLALAMAELASLRASGIAVRLGPPSIGTGGTNPIAIPPEASDMGVSYVTENKVEYNFAATGLTIATRDQKKWGGYTSFGGGLLWSAHGIGIGPYLAFGIERGCLPWVGCLAVEFSQSVGFGSGVPVTPSAFRIGLMRWF